jgi:hypothetical protein
VHIPLTEREKVRKKKSCEKTEIGNSLLNLYVGKQNNLIAIFKQIYIRKAHCMYVQERKIHKFRTI